MTRDEFKILVKAMKAVYTQPSFIPDQDAFDIWYELLKDLDYKTASYAVKKYMQSEEKEPKVSSIRKHAESIKQKQNDELNEMAAWSLVQKALRNSGYHAEEEFEKLPPIVQRTIVSPGQLREWATKELSGDGWNVIQSNFMRTYRAESEKEKEIRKLSPDILKLIQENKALKISKKEHEDIRKLSSK